MALARKFSFPQGHWALPGRGGFNHGVRKDEMIFVAGQMDLDSGGAVCHAQDLWAQLQAAMVNVRRVLEDLDADLNDVVKLEVYYVNRRDVDEAAVLAALHRHFETGVPPALYLIPLRELALPGLMISIEAIAMRYAGGMRVQRLGCNPPGHWPTPFSHGIRCGEMIFVGTQMPRDAQGRTVEPGDAVAQAEVTLRNIDTVLQGLGADLEDVYNINTRYVGGGSVEEWARAANVRANIWKTPGKNGTGLPVTDLLDDGLTIRQEVTAMRGIDGRRLACDPLFPAGSWNWPIPVRVQQAVRVGKMVFVGGQISADTQGRTVFAGDLGAQTATAMKFIRRCVAEAGGGMSDIVKLKSYFRNVPEPPLGPLTRTTAICAAFFDDPGPAATAVPLPYLGLEGATVEIEVVAMVD